MASLTQDGAKALSDDELKALIVGKSIWVRNNVTGEDIKIRYDEDGTAVVLHVGRSATLPSLSGDLARASYETTASPYTISGGKIVTHLSGTPIAMAVYKSTSAQAGNTPREHDTYYGARSNEFGYANYEILLEGPANLMSSPRASHGKGPGPVAVPARSCPGVSVPYEGFGWNRRFPLAYHGRVIKAPAARAAGSLPGDRRPAVRRLRLLRARPRREASTKEIR